MLPVFEDIRLAGWHAFDGLGRAGPGDGAIVAVDAAVMAYLEEEGTVAKKDASFDTFRAADAQFFVNGVLVIRVLQGCPFNGSCRAKLVFSAGVQGVWLRIKISGAQLAVAAHFVDLNAFDGGGLKHAFGGAIGARDTLVRIDLPHGFFPACVACDERGDSAKKKQKGAAKAAAQELASI